jgi:hypothetical protein
VLRLCRLYVEYRVQGAAPNAPAGTVTLPVNGTGVHVQTEHSSVFFLLDVSPTFATVSAQIRMTDGSQCREWQQVVAVVGEQLAPFDIPTECFGFCGDKAGICSPITICARRVPPETGSRLGTRFHIGLVDYPDATRLIQLFSVDAKTEERSVFLRGPGCGAPVGWSFNTNVGVFANPKLAKYQVVVREIYFSVNGRHVQMRQVLLPA